MKFSVLLLLACTVIRTNAISDNDIDALETVFPVVVKYLQNSGFQKYLGNVTIVEGGSSPVFDDTLLEGVLNYTNLYLIGLDGMDTTRDFLTLNVDKNASLITLGLNLSVNNEIGVQMEQYDVDMVLVQTVPLYGSGSFKFTFYSFGLIANVTISYDQNNTDFLNNLVIIPTLSRATFHVNGFWRNPEFSNLLSEIITGFIDLFVVIWDLEIDCMSCILSKILQNIASQLIIDKTASLNLNSTFIQESCTSICSPSQNTLVQTLLQSRPEQLLEYVATDNLLRYADIAVDYLNEEIERLNL